MNKLYAGGLAAVFLALLGSTPVVALADNDHTKAQVKVENSGQVKAHPSNASASKMTTKTTTKMTTQTTKMKTGSSDSAHNCVNPAGNMRGWCKTHRGSFRGAGTLSGTVVSITGNVAVVRLDNGALISVNENGTALNVGQHYNLNGCYQGNVFVLGCYTSGNYPGGANQQLSGTILSISGNIVTLLGLPPVSINVQAAIAANRTNGPLTVGRHITAYGSYRDGTFYATTIQ